MLTHFCLLGFSAGTLAVLYFLPLYIGIPVAVVLYHRLIVLVHEYVHDIPFKEHRHNKMVLTFIDCALLGCGALELFTALHLKHHAWLNTPKDPAWADTKKEKKSLKSALAGLELVHLIRHLFGEDDSPVNRKRAAVHMMVSIAWGALLTWFGFGKLVVSLLVVSWIAALVTSSLRGSVEHHGPPDDEAFSHEYRPILPAFNINRHIHHHLQPKLPWYDLRYVTERPLSRWCFFTHWYRAHITGEYVLIKPMKGEGKLATMGSQSK
jgi:fatty acid desaturase